MVDENKNHFIVLAIVAVVAVVALVVLIAGKQTVPSVNYNTGNSLDAQDVYGQAVGTGGTSVKKCGGPTCYCPPGYSYESSTDHCSELACSCSCFNSGKTPYSVDGMCGKAA